MRCGRGWLGAVVARQAAGHSGRCTSTAGFLTLQFKPQSCELQLWSQLWLKRSSQLRTLDDLESCWQSPIFLSAYDDLVTYITLEWMIVATLPCEVFDTLLTHSS